MHIIIDGYNLIKQLFGVSRVNHAKRDDYVDQLVKRAQARGHKLVIVFDGGEFGFPSSESRDGAQIWYSGYRESADEVIKRYVAEHRSYDLFVVTSDRAIKDFVRSMGVQTIDALEFGNMFFENRSQDAGKVVVSGDAPAIKMSKEANPELDALMKSLDTGIVVKYDDRHKERRSSGLRESKKDREFLKKIKKL